MKPSRSARLCVGLVLLLSTRVESQANNLSTTMIPVPSDQVSNNSRYYEQMEFITDFLLNNAGNLTTPPSDLTTPPSNTIQESNVTLSSITNLDDYTSSQENIEATSSGDDNTITNELQVIPNHSVPVVFSSVIDTLPVHPRIPRGSVAKRRTRVRLNRHSTRVNPNAPVRFLLPPPIKKHKCSGQHAKPDPPFKIKPIVISSSTPLIPISAVATPNEYVVTAQPLRVKTDQKESSPVNAPLKNRVFVPPPPRHLIPPPFSPDNNLNNYYTTPQNSLPERNSVRPFTPQNNAHEPSTKTHDCDKTNRIESPPVKPIVVVEDIREINGWNTQSSPSPPVHSSSYNEPVRNVEFINNKEPERNLESFNNFPSVDVHNQFLASTTSENPPVYEQINIPHQDFNNKYETKPCDKNHSIPASQPLHSYNVLPNNPQQLNFNNQPLPANEQIFFPNSQDSFQNNKVHFMPNIPKIYSPNNQPQFPNNQLQSSSINQISPNDQHHFNQDYQQLLSADNQQTLSTKNPQDFKFNNAQPLNNHDLAHENPPCNESDHQFTLDINYSQQQFPSDNQYNQQKFSPHNHNSQDQLSPSNQYNQQQFPSDKQHNQQQLPSDKQYHQHQLPLDNQHIQHQIILDNQHNKHQLNPNHLFNQQQFPADKQYNQQQLNPDNQQHYVSNNQQEVIHNNQHSFSSSDQIYFPQTSATQTSVTREPGPYSSFKSSPFEQYSLKPTTPLPLSSSSEPYPILRGPNIEQTLFETGNFQVDGISYNDTDDSTVAMMNRPLLTQEVAQMGMKITANLKMEQINKAKFNRGKYKYNHLNQFNFPNLDEPSRSNEVSKSSKLTVAETSYYKDRRGVQELSDLSVIPGTPGVDYPILNRPPLKSDFSCRSVENHRGYVADPSTRCQVFYICVGSGPGEAMLCPNGTLFSQDFLVCDWWFNIDCQPYS